MTTPEIPEAAVLAAAGAMYSQRPANTDPKHWETPWEDVPESWKQGQYRAARQVLEAAMPAIREQIAAEVSNYWDACGELIDNHNGARLAFDAVITQIREGDA